MRTFKITFSNNEEIIFEMPETMDFGYNKYYDRSMLSLRNSKFDQEITSLNSLCDEVNNKFRQREDMEIVALTLISEENVLMKLSDLNTRNVEYRISSFDRNVKSLANDYEELTFVLT